MTRVDRLAHVIPAVTIYDCDTCGTTFAGTHVVDAEGDDHCRECRPVDGVDEDDWNLDDLRALDAEWADAPSHGTEAQRAMARAHYAGEIRQGIIDNRPVPKARRAYHAAGGR